MVTNLPSVDTEYSCPVISLQYSQIFILSTNSAKRPECQSSVNSQAILSKAVRCEQNSKGNYKPSVPADKLVAYNQSHQNLKLNQVTRG